MYKNKAIHKARVDANKESKLAALERVLSRDPDVPAVAVRDLAGVVGNGVPRARCTTFLSMLLREEVPLAGGGVFVAAADFRPVGFLGGRGEGAVLGSFFWRLRMSFPRSSSALL
jgi:hypothetical protein